MKNLNTLVEDIYSTLEPLSQNKAISMLNKNFKIG